MDTIIKSLFALVALSWLFRPRKTFYASWNVEASRFKSTRTMLLFAYFVCVGILLVVLNGDDPSGFVFGHGEGRGIQSGVGMTVLGTIYVFLVLAIDANFVASRTAGFERNSFKNWLFGMTSLPILVTVIFLNRYLIPVFLVVWITGWFYQAPGR